jgi:hypothetical protein
MESGPKNPRNQRRARRYNRALKKLLERRAKQAWQKQLEWLRRPRLHTAIFEDARRDDQIADDWASKHKMSIEEREIVERQRANRAKEIDRRTKDLGWSNERLAAFKQAVVYYREEPTIENYVRVRKMFPEVEIEVSRFGGIEALFALEDKLKKFGVDPALVATALDADEPSIDALSLHLLELLTDREKLPKDGPKRIEERRNAISDTIVNYLIAEMLEALDWHGQTFRIPASLVVLIRHQLCGVNPDLHEEYLSRERLYNAGFSLGRKLKPNEKLSIREIAKFLQVPRSTVARWLDDKDFQRSVETARKWTAEGMYKGDKGAWKKGILEGGW